MAKKNSTSFVWKCEDCGHNTKVFYNFQFNMSETYNGDAKCDHCGKVSNLEFSFNVRPTGQKWEKK